MSDLVASFVSSQEQAEVYVDDWDRRFCFCYSHNTLEVEDCLRIGSHGYSVGNVCLFNSVKQLNGWDKFDLLIHK